MYPSPPLRGKQTSHPCVLEVRLNSLGLPHSVVLRGDGLSRELLGGLISDSLDFMVFHLLSDGGLGEIWQILLFILHQLDLDWFWGILHRNLR